MGSFAKRARALVIFTTGLLPVAAAQAQDTPACEFELQISKIASARGNLFTKDEDPAIFGWFQIQVEANKVTPANKELLVSPTAMVSNAYYWQTDGTLASYDLEVRNPYIVAQGDIGPSFDAALNIDGLAESYTMETSTQYHWDTLTNSSAGDAFGALKQDVVLTLGPPDGDATGTSYAFSFPKAEFAKAYKSAQPQFTALMSKAQAGACRPAHQVSSSGSGDAGSVGCFLTTAACEGVGLADDCWELRTLRAFRDGWLARQHGGMDDIVAYYDKAPAIAERLKGNRQDLLRLYWTRVVPSALAAQFGANRLARAIYSKGIRELTAAMPGQAVHFMR
ncbi:MAG: hypothetical protein P0Y56_17015 [Candidatus Andeanibacterium colombiense]|uniref:Uncharacterized protein n=1 Tax=Candidatus Andeanibacterium colombiense TaxID=3121345 RepID=A0AAJ5X6U9_9SPHN|nr:MAG: hypothetical protein P0Y56_17015 [Sphingomonadaceae bacterium]